MINFSWFPYKLTQFFHLKCLILLFIFANEFYWFLNKWPIKLQGKKLIWGNGSKQSENWLGKLNAWPNSFEATRNVNEIFWLKVPWRHLKQPLRPQLITTKGSPLAINITLFFIFLGSKTWATASARLECSL